MSSSLHQWHSLVNYASLDITFNEFFTLPVAFPCQLYQDAKPTRDAPVNLTQLICYRSLVHPTLSWTPLILRYHGPHSQQYLLHFPQMILLLRQFFCFYAGSQQYLLLFPQMILLLCRFTSLSFLPKRSNKKSNKLKRSNCKPLKRRHIMTVRQSKAATFQILFMDKNMTGTKVMMKMSKRMKRPKALT